MSRSWSETLRRLSYRSDVGNWKTLKKYAAKWGIDTAHFDPEGASVEGLRRAVGAAIPLNKVMVEGSTYGRAHLKRRLFNEGLKDRRCEGCGQDELWRGGRLALILDHINGVPNDHRFENLRILCPNCAATLKTHCGRKNQRPARICKLCGKAFVAKRREQRYCSRQCGSRYLRKTSRRYRKVSRPPYEQLMREIEATGYEAVGRKYGVSGNAIRKWVRACEQAEAG